MLEQQDIQMILPLMLRWILGAWFFFQAYDKIFRLGLNQVTETVCKDCEKRDLRPWFVHFSVTVSSFIELLGGALLILGLAIPYAMVLLALDLIMVSIAFGYLNGLWDTKHVFPRIVLLSALFLIPFEWDVLSIDFLINS